MDTFLNVADERIQIFSCKGVTKTIFSPDYKPLFAILKMSLTIEDKQVEMSNEIILPPMKWIITEIKLICCLLNLYLGATSLDGFALCFNLITQHAPSLAFSFLGNDRDLTRFPDISKAQLLIPQVALGPLVTTSN